VSDLAAVAALLLGAAATCALFLIAKEIRTMSDSLSASFAEITTDLGGIVTGLQTIATNIANNPNIPAADVTEAQGFATQLDSISASVAALAAQTGGTPPAQKPAGS
jgi:hypothetical protein